MTTTAKHQPYCTCPDRAKVQCSVERRPLPASHPAHALRAAHEAEAHGDYDQAATLRRIAGES